MKGIARFAEYGVTGGLLWFLVFLFFSINQADDLTLKSVIQFWSNQVSHVNEIFQPIAHQNTLSVSVTESGTIEKSLISAPKSDSLLDLKSTITGLLSGLAIILVFCTGLLLDLIAPSLCGTFELVYLKHNLRRSQQDWYERLLEMHRDFLENSYEQLSKTRVREWINPKSWQQDRHAYHCLRNFLFGYLYVNAGQTQQGPLLEKVRIWRTGRATAMSLLLLGVLMGSISLTQVNVSSSSQMIISIVIPIALILISGLVSVITFSRMYNSVLSHVYHTNIHESAEKMQEVRDLLEPFMKSNQIKEPSLAE